METLEDELDRGRDAGGGLAHAEVGERLPQAVELVLEGLHLSKRLNKDAIGGRAAYRGKG